MTLTKYTASTAIIAALSDLPNATDGLSAAQFKAKFDENPEAFKTFVNSLIDQLESVTDGSSGADQIGATSITGLTGNTVQVLLEALKTLFDGYVIDQIPDGSLTDVKLSGDAADIKARFTSHKAETANPGYYGAVGDGIANDTTAFTNLEAESSGRVVDLNGKTYLVNVVPQKNSYYNGVFLVGANTRPALLVDTFSIGSPKAHTFGGQLAKLKNSLANPLEQITSIVFIGDSITWGRTLAENSIFDPRDGTLSDPRDNFGSPSFVNTFKRYIGENYAFGASPTLSNWAASASGEAIAEYAIQHILYPHEGDFTLTTTGTSTSVTEVFTSASITGAQLQLAAASSGTGEHKISFTFTGDSFTFSFGATTDALDYELFVDGVSQGIFSATPGVGGVVAGNDNRRVHSFSYVRNKIIEIKTVQAGYVGTGKLRVEGIIINKTIRITNQGIIGATSNSYTTNNLPGNASGDGNAVETEDNYVFCMLGTNDRITSSSKPKGSNEFRANLQALLDIVIPLSNVILMCANPADNEDTATYSFTMQRVRDVIYRAAKDNTLDMIDNYSIFGDSDINVLTADGLHPNNVGMQLTSRNIINSLESS